MNARRRWLGWLMALACPMTLAAQVGDGGLARRHGITFEPRLFPQATPQEALSSIVKAIDRKQINYLLAHLAEPKFVDDRVAEYASSQRGSDEVRLLLGFERLARETLLHFQEDPALVKELRQYVKDADWDVQESTATGTLKTASPRRVFLRKLEDRWFLENRQQ